MATEQTGNSGHDGERGWETAMHGQIIWFVMLCLVRTGCAKSSLTVGTNIWPFISNEEDPRELLLEPRLRAHILRGRKC